MKKGDTVRCVRSEPEGGTRLSLGQTYVVARTFRGKEKVPGCFVEGLTGYFAQSRFEVVSDAGV